MEMCTNMLITHASNRAVFVRIAIAVSLTDLGSKFGKIFYLMHKNKSFFATIFSTV